MKSTSQIDFHGLKNDLDGSDLEEDDFVIRDDVPETVKQKLFDRIQMKQAQDGNFHPMESPIFNLDHQVSTGTDKTEDAIFQKVIDGEIKKVDESASFMVK